MPAPPGAIHPTDIQATDRHRYDRKKNLVRFVDLSSDLGLNPIVSTGSGNDSIWAFSAFGGPLDWQGKLRIITGADDDFVRLFQDEAHWDDSTVIRLDVLTGSGDDSVVVGNGSSVSPQHVGRFDGGSGTDQLADLDGLFPQARRFEVACPEALGC